MIRGLVPLAVVHAACLGPLVEDEIARSPDLLPAGSIVPRVEEDAVLAMQLRAHQFVAGVVPRYAGFGNGAPLEYWDFGPVPTHVAPVYVLVDANGQRIDHPEVVGVIPGDDGYSPFWRVAKVIVTAAYRGEVIASTAALDDAQRLGLVEPPAREDAVALAPIVTHDVRLDTKAGPRASDEVFYYRGRAATYFAFGDCTVAAAPRYVLRREGGEPLNEVMRSVDIDGDGDALDSNDILAYATCGAYVTWHVVVPASTSSIDTTGDQTKADHTSAAQLFAPDPIPNVVLGYTVEPGARALVPTTALEDEP